VKYGKIGVFILWLRKPEQEKVSDLSSGTHVCSCSRGSQLIPLPRDFPAALADREGMAVLLT